MAIPHSVGKLQKMVQRYQSTSRHVREKAGETMQTAIGVGVSAGSGFLLGYMSKKAPAQFATSFGAGVPFPLAMAVAAHAAALMGVGRGMEEHIRTVGDSAITAHLFLLGQDAAEGAAGGPGGYRVSGAGITQADLLRAAR